MKIEMHTHTSQSSPCAKIPAEQVVALYHSKGYQTLVITDHYNKWAMEQSGTTTPADYATHVMKGYYAAKEAAKAFHMLILPAVEVSLLESPNDYLVYGMPLDFLPADSFLWDLSLEDFSALCHHKGCMVLQAHPFRSYCSPADASLLDGAEAFNGNPRHTNHNDKASAWIQEHHLIPSSGSDFHEEEDLACGGIETTVPVTGWADLLQLLKSGNYTY